MRILFTIDTWALIGGTERLSAAAVAALVERGHEVAVLCRRAGPEERGGVPVLERPELAGNGLAAGDRSALRREVERIAPDAVLVSALRNLDALEALLDAAPVVRYVHDHTLFCPGLNKVREGGEVCRDPMGLVCLERYYLGSGCVCFKPAVHEGRGPFAPVRDWLAKRREVETTRRAARVLTNSHYMREELLRVGFDPERTSVVHPFTRSNTADQPCGPLPPATAEFLGTAGPPLVLTPARLTLPDKGVDFLLTALGRVRLPHRAVVAGTGPAAGWLVEKARAEGLAERVHFTGWLDSGALETLYGRASVVVVPSVWNEPFGLVGLEAMAHGKPLVAFDAGGVPDWLADGENGLLVPRRDVDAMAEAIDRLLESPGLARRMGARGREIQGERFTRAAHVEGLERALAAAAAEAAVTSWSRS